MSNEASKKPSFDWEAISMHIITFAGSAKSDAMEAIFLAKKQQFAEAKATLKHANSEVAEAARAHFDVVAKEAEGNQIAFNVLFMHAEDQLLTTQTIIVLAEEFIAVHERISEIEKKLKIA